ncbi:MAG: carboxypeptidase-like regulatory domain-containing protein [Thermoanaerobaculia bacterium]
MTRISRIPVVVAVIAVMLAVPAFAAGKRRAVVHPTNSLSDVTVKGVVLDDATSQPVKNVDVTSGNAKTVTDASGRFQLVFKSGAIVPLRISRSGYVTRDVTVAPGSETTFRLTPTPTVRVKMTTAGTEFAVDAESVQFAFESPMSGYPMNEYPRFCRNGQEFQPARATLAKIEGPATSVTDASCCDRGPVMSVKVTLKSGETADARFADNCFGYQPVFVARDHVSGEFRFLHFTDISEIVFP